MIINSTRALVFAFLLFASLTNLLAQDGQLALRLPTSSSSALMLGAANRLVIPQGRQWRLVMAPVDARFTVGAFFRQQNTIFAGTDNKGLYVSQGQDSLQFLTRKDGLASNVVTAVAGDEKRVFVGTEGGLSIYEEPIFVTFTPHNSPLPAAAVTHLELDGEGGVWVVTRNGGARVTKDDEVLTWPKSEGAPPQYITAFTRWPNVGVAAAAAGAIHILVKDQWVKRSFEFTPVALLPLPAGGLAIAGLDSIHYLARVDGDIKPLTRMTGVTSLALAAGQLWAANGAGVSVIGRPSDLGVRTESPLPQKPIEAIQKEEKKFAFTALLRRSGQLLAYGPDGLFTRENGGWNRLWPAAGLHAQGVAAAVVAPDERLWIVSMAGRIFYLRGNTWQSLVTSQTFDSPVVSATLAPSGDKLILLTQRGSLTELSVR